MPKKVQVPMKSILRDLKSAMDAERFMIGLILESIPENEIKQTDNGFFVRRAALFLACAQQFHFSKIRSLAFISACSIVRNTNRGLYISVL